MLMLLLCADRWFGGVLVCFVVADGSRHVCGRGWWWRPLLLTSASAWSPRGWWRHLLLVDVAGGFLYIRRTTGGTTWCFALIVCDGWLVDHCGHAAITDGVITIHIMHN